MKKYIQNTNFLNFFGLIILMLLTTFLLNSCKKDISSKKQHELAHDIEGNIYEDEILQNIYSLQNERNSQKLLKYLNNEYPEYRKAGILAFASLQDSSAILPISVLFDDTDEDVRLEVAYTLGQIGHISAENILIKAYETEKSNKVKKEILEAIGKCGSEKGLLFITTLEIPETDYVLLAGQAWGLNRFAIRGYTSSQSTEKAMSILSYNEQTESIRFIISHYFSYSKNIDLTEFHSQLKVEFEKDGYVYTKMNLIKAFGNSQSIYSLDFLHSVLQKEFDYRIKVNAIRACEKFNYEYSKDIMFELLTNKTLNIAITASEFFVNKGVAIDADMYNKIAKKLTAWQTRSYMLMAALKYSENKEIISNSIISGYEVTENIYEKASLLEALEGDPTQYKFVENQIFYSNDKILSTSGMKTIIKMRENSNFESYSTLLNQKNGDNLYEEFALIFKKAIQSKDVALITLASEALINEDLKLIDYYPNNYFLTQALNNCQLPQDLEAYNALSKTIKYFNGTEISKINEITYAPINWDLITSISPEQIAVIKTTKGDITIKLNVNQAPIAVSTFITMAKEKYYDGTAFHRVVPNFVIQDGCERGDGWGMADFAIRSEFAPSYFEEGSVGLASSGKDTESVQWFITQFPTANLDGKYTLFATVVDGLQLIHEIEVGDQIISIEIE